MVETLALHPARRQCNWLWHRVPGQLRRPFALDLPHRREQLATARVRFFVVALTGFAINQTAYAWALHVFGPDYYLPVLAAVLLGVAGATFLLSKLWAFAEPQG